MALIEVQALEKTYGAGATAVRALGGVNLRVEAGEFVAVRGPSGSGKSTLLHLLGGLDSPTAGTVSIEGQSWHLRDDGQASHFRRTRLGFVFQAFHLVPAFSAQENVALPLLLEGARPSDVEAQARARLVSVGLAARADHRPHELSGGEQQRVAVARALVAEPVLVLADEPTGNLDRAAGTLALEALRRAVDEEHRTVVMVTHDPHAASFATRIIDMRDGLIVGDGPGR